MFVSIAYAANEFCVNGQKTTVEEQEAIFDAQGNFHIFYTTIVTINTDAECVSVEFPSTCVTKDDYKNKLTIRQVIRDTAGTIVSDETVSVSSGPIMKICN
jgi:hypothetical protein